MNSGWMAGCLSELTMNTEDAANFVGACAVHQLVAEVAGAIEVSDIYFEKSLERFKWPPHLRLIIIKLIEVEMKQIDELPFMAN